jgi:hypothetical protein
VHSDGRRAELVPGGTLDLGNGTLRYDELRTWMGYRVTYDATLPWLLAAALLAAFALAWHYTQRFFFGPRAGAGAPLPNGSRVAAAPDPIARGAADA